MANPKYQSPCKLRVQHEPANLSAGIVDIVFIGGLEAAKYPFKVREPTSPNLFRRLPSQIPNARYLIYVHGVRPANLNTFTSKSEAGQLFQALEELRATTSSVSDILSPPQGSAQLETIPDQGRLSEFLHSLD